MVEAVSTGLPAYFTITDARTHESTQLLTGPWVENVMLLFDQAYFDYRTMDLINANGGWFLTRLKPNSNPEITNEFRKWRGNAISMEGKQVQEILDDHHRDVINVGGEDNFDDESTTARLRLPLIRSVPSGSGTKRNNTITSTSRICRLKSIARLISRSSIRRAGSERSLRLLLLQGAP
ncbi:transposase [Natronorarus salvus]|uniref:transposase n=1 Tax=Natronorarus salvus TaxID=3117733 RepID=UPI002F26955C